VRVQTAGCGGRKTDKYKSTFLMLLQKREMDFARRWGYWSGRPLQLASSSLGESFTPGFCRKSQWWKLTNHTISKMGINPDMDQKI
jgi:hypothetical protein